MPANYVLLERIELNASASSVTFSNIPQSGYTDLKIVLTARNTNDDTVLRTTFNNSGTGYSGKRLYGTGSAATSDSISGAYFTISLAEPSSFTTNVFSNAELYVPNYLSSNYKSVSFDYALETNATTSYVGMVAGLWSDTSAITSITFTSPSASIAQYSTFSLYGLAAVGTTPAIAPKATGGNITTDGTYWYHTFLSTGAFVPATDLTCDYLVVAGGGSAGSGSGGSGGGGAGGLRSATTQSFANGIAYTCTIGGGGSAVTNTNGNNGTNSSISGSGFTTFTASGGGYGGKAAYNTAGSVGGSGGSGGGGSSGGQGTSAGGAGNAGSYSPVEGYAGGNGNGSLEGCGAGGGGAGAVGATAGSASGGNGGAGVNTYSSWASATVTGVSGYYGGGGGGAGLGTGASQGAGGAGGGGTASAYGSTAGDGVVNTGGGGGARAGNGSSAQPSGAGGSGVVIIRYAV